MCNPSDCDDGDPCTEDRCVAHVGCVHEPPTGFDAATCRLEVVATTLAAAAPVELGGGDTKAALEKRIARTIHLLERARTARGRLARDNPRRARQFVRGFIRRIQTGAALGRIPADLAQRLVVPARTALEVLYALAGLPPP